jgi:hypothetical protein
MSQLGGGNGDVHGAAAQELAEVEDVLEADTDVIGIDVHPTASERHDVGRICGHLLCSFAVPGRIERTMMSQLGSMLVRT